jgi:HK97 family phage prohead protease
MDRTTIDIKQEDGWIIASTPDVDRQRDRVFPAGLVLDNYRKNPVLVYGHSYHEPWSVIGKAGEIEVDMAGLRIKPELREPANDSDPMHIVRALWDQGLLKAASIGFIPLETADNSLGGRDITKAELLEISLVPIPANQSALRLAAKAFDDRPIEAGPGLDNADEPTLQFKQSPTEVVTEPITEAGSVEIEAPPPEPAKSDQELTPEQEAALQDTLDGFLSGLRTILGV